MGADMTGNSKADIVVIGSGVSGLAAAVAAAEGGAKVVVYEKQRSMGGTSNFFEGIFAVESDMQRARYIEYSRDQAFKNIMEYNHWRANARLVRAFVDKSADTIDWLRQQGVEFMDATANTPDGYRTYHTVKGTGAAVVKALATRAKEKRVELRLGTPVIRVLKEGGKISGVIADEDGEELHVGAKAVIVASGGYANNKEWIKKYSGFDLGGNLIPIGNVDKMGDGIRMAWEVGAAQEGLGVLELFRAGPIGPELKTQVELAAAQPDLWINPRGERFCDESIIFSDSSVGNANAKFAGGFTFSIFDNSITQRLVKEGFTKTLGTENSPGTRATRLEKEISVLFEKENADMFAAASLEELAGKIGVDPAVLKATVEEYNRFCEKGHDDLFAKDPKYLHPLKGPRFYAVKARTVFLGTLGGIRINHRTEVVDKKDNIIPGLYAVGFDAGGMYGDSYHIQPATGASAGFAVNSGRIAGENALQYIQA